MRRQQRVSQRAQLGVRPLLVHRRFAVGDIGELHLGGFTPEEDEAEPGAEILIDTHAARIAEPVWELYAHAIRRFGAKPTLIEWDNDIPPFAALLAEARCADEVAARALALKPRHAVAG